MSQKAKISITIDNVMHLAIPGANANNSITGLHTIPIPHYNQSNCIVIAMLEMLKRKVVRWYGVKACDVISNCT